MDEVEWSKAKTKPLNGFEAVRRKPLPLLLGLTLGLGVGWPALLFLGPIIAPVPPVVVGGVLTLYPCTQAVGLGSVAAACGIVTFLIATLVGQMIL